MRRALVTLTLLAALTGLTACDATEGTGGKGYISGDGSVSELAAADRGDPIDLVGADLEGQRVDLGDLRGQVVVVNFWGAWCPPCRAEMPDLVAVADDVQADVRFLGVNVRDTSIEKAASFVRTYDVPFPTIWDPDGAALLSFPTALVRLPPTTLVLDREGRIAAYVIGVIPSELTLRDLIDTVAAEPGGEPSGEPSDG